MTTIRFFLDETSSPVIAAGGRARGLDITAAVEAGRLGLSDADHLRWAADNNFVIVTADRGFIRWHGQCPWHLGLVLIEHDMRIGHVLDWLDLIARVVPAEEMYGHLEIVPRELP